MADVTAGAARYASVAEVRADVERAGGDASGLCGFGRCFCVKTALGIRRKERGHWPRFQESERRNRKLLATAIAKERQDRTGQNKQELKNRQNKQKQTKPYLQNKQLISACGSRAGQRMQEEGKYML